MRQPFPGYRLRKFLTSWSAGLPNDVPKNEFPICCLCHGMCCRQCITLDRSNITSQRCPCGHTLESATPEPERHIHPADESHVSAEMYPITGRNFTSQVNITAMDQLRCRLPKIEMVPGSDPRDPPFDKDHQNHFTRFESSCRVSITLGRVSPTIITSPGPLSLITLLPFSDRSC